jgi:hypothetical protein
MPVLRRPEASPYDPLEGLSPGHDREDEHGEEHESDHHGQREVFVAPGGYEEGSDHGGAHGDGQGEHDGRAHKILLKYTATIRLKTKNATAADLDSERCPSSTAAM